MTGLAATAGTSAPTGIPSVLPQPVRSDWPRHEADEIEAVQRVLGAGRVNALVHGDENRKLAQEFADYVGAEHAFCVANGTVSLELALRAFGIGQGDEVIVPARSFFATASSVLAVGATPVFADIEPVSQNIDPASAERLVGPRTKAVICVHLGGWPCDMDRLMTLAERHGLRLIEDCAQAHGAAWHGRRVGSFADAGSFSFCTDKIMSTGGEGGLVTFRDRDVHDRAWSYKDHGKNPVKMAEGGSPGQFRYICDGPGSNFRMTEMQAAIGRRQLAKLPGWLAQRARNAATLLERLAADERLLLPTLPAGIEHAWYKFNFRLADPRQGNVEDLRASLLAHLAEMQMPVGTGSCPDMSREAVFEALPIRRDGDLAQANDLGRRSLMVPVDHTLDEDDMHRLADAILMALDNLP